MSSDPAPESELLSRAEYRPAWRRDDPGLERDAVAFWRRLGILPPVVSPEARAKELVCVAYLDGEVAAVATATLEVLPFLRARAALYRSATDPEKRRRWLVAQIAAESVTILEDWAAANPQEAVKGMAIVLENPFLAQVKQLPVWRYRHVALGLVGYSPEGHQIRMNWFRHARLDLPSRGRAGAGAAG
jgi:hypothetical protein